MHVRKQATEEGPLLAISCTKSKLHCWEKKKKKEKKHREVVNFCPNDDETKSQNGSNKQKIY